MSSRSAIVPLIAAAALSLFHTGCQHRPAPVPQEQCDPLTLTAENANAFADDWAGDESIHAGENFVICPAGLRHCLGIAAGFAAGETRAALTKAGRLPASPSAMETDAILQYCLTGDLVKMDCILDSTTLRLTPSGKLHMGYWYANLSEGAFDKPEATLTSISAKESAGAREATTLPLPFSAADLANAWNQRTGLLLISRTRFKTTWETGFTPNAVTESLFHPANAAAYPVPMMREVSDQPCAVVGKSKVVQLAYHASQATMLLILPDEGEDAAFRQNFTPSAYLKSLDKLSLHHATVTLPRFELNHPANVRRFLDARGAAGAFDRIHADYSAGLTASTSGWKPALGEIRQTAFIRVNEEGTEAGSITAMNHVTTFGAQPEPPEYPPMELRFDRPFYFIIEQQGMILFAGRCGLPPKISARDRALISLQAFAERILTTKNAKRNAETKEDSDPTSNELTLADIEPLLTEAQGKFKVRLTKVTPQLAAIDPELKDKIGEATELELMAPKHITSQIILQYGTYSLGTYDADGQWVEIKQ